MKIKDKEMERFRRKAMKQLTKRYNPKLEEKINLAKINEAYHRKQMEYFQEQINILKGKHEN